MMRLFIAAELDELVVAALEQVQQSLRQALGTRAIRWTDPRGIHLTLKFLGDTDERKVADLQRALEETCASHTAIALSLSRLGVFPNRRRPRVLWAGIEGDVAGLERLQRSVEAAMCHLGLPPEDRPFSPHLTLGRVRDEATASDCDRIGAALEADAPLPAVAQRVEAVSLFRSVLLPNGPQYTRLFVAPLKP